MSLEDLTTDQLLSRARETEGAFNTLSALSQNPETREGLQRLLKKANPKLVIPEIDAKDAVLAQVTDSNKRVEKLEQQILERDIRDRLERQKDAIKREFKLTDDDIQGVEALMIQSDTNPDPIPTYRAAAQVYRAQRQSAVPTPATFSAPTYDMPEKDTWGKGIGNPALLNKIAMDQAFGAWNEIQSGKVAGLGPAR